ncbi:MAG: preprotein translocase subunit SecA [Candidatus Staskawiczbacteria bacterium RIFCSPLOWO2_12_FULL_37_15]|uniref:Protein translocase subunit SecA n=1 Tax=Candidatus Staskawiczbacteria bacterium RIFCSPLOWO2_12_FULL_37_15 TaxID=1802218 RepID=A0A1G2IQA0_9BACT|nr:MAG: preprotein translocase subunit SecA [Candidatus Staskawiczbacteria bacterium RIFCSPLOWO2_12_FULL_37_15]
MSIFSKIFGDPNEKYIKGLAPIVEKINSFEPEFQKFSAEQLKEKTKEFKERLAKGQTLDYILPEVFALVREAAKRTLNQRHFDSQLIGGIVLHQGKIAEMRTGEGKTLSATLPAYLNAIESRGVHIVTVNDYLAKRDMVWMGQIYDALGLSVGCIVNESGYIYDANYKNNLDKERDILGGFKVVQEFLKPCSRREAYEADITYGTNHEFGFDYLRDNMVYDLSQTAQRGFNFCIVDEVDSILIDEARVPLIISGQEEEATEKYYQFAKIVLPLEGNPSAGSGQVPSAGSGQADYTVDEKMKAVSFTEAGQNRVIKSLGSDPWLDNDITITHQLESALRAKVLFLKDRDYVVKGGEIMIIDEFTGRILPGRRWSAGLHQAVEAKENLEVKPESLTLATITFQNYFRLYKKISGMTGTAITSAEELDKVYNLEVAVIPTNKPMVRKDLADKVFKTESGKFSAVVKEIEGLNKKGQPVLVGTRSVERNEYLGKLLEVKGIPHQILNAKNHEREGEIIAQAGKKGAVTIATNMAGRGVDIILGGNPPNLDDSRGVGELGGLHVVGTERHDARRIDNQLRGRAGRQGDPGSSQFFVSLEDDLMRIFGGDKIKNLMTALKVPDDEPIQANMISGAIESAQSKIEGFNFDARNHLLEYDDVMNKHREIIYKKRHEFLAANPPAGGLKDKILEIFKKAGFSEGDYNKKEKEIGEEDMHQVEKFVSLKVLDNLWQAHLSDMDHLRDSVRLRTYGGQDPLVEYKNEGHRMFHQLLQMIDANIADNIMKAGLKVQQNPVRPTPGVGGITPGVNHEPGRNDPCPCGSGKKYKKCGILNTEEHQKLMVQKK